MQLNLQTFSPSYAIVKEANTHDSTEAKEMCATIKDGEIVVFDKAYVDFKHLYHLDSRGVNWVTRSKDNMTYDIIEERSSKGSIISDQLIKLNGVNTEKHYPKVLRLVIANVEVDGKMKTLKFMTNNLQWASSSIASIYQSRWGIEVFFSIRQLSSNLTH